MDSIAKLHHHHPLLCSTSATITTTHFSSHSSSFIRTPNFSTKPLTIHTKLLAKVSNKDFNLNDEGFASGDDLQFVVPLKIVEYPDPRLRAKNKRVNVFDDNLKKLVAEMFDVMYKFLALLFGSQKTLMEEAFYVLKNKCKKTYYLHFTGSEKLAAVLFHRTDGIGLAAPQVGVNIQLMVFNPVGERGEGEEIVLVNPRVTKSSQKIITFEEGCLSFPGLYADVKRPESVKIDAKDLSGSRFSVTLSGLPARVFQHEFDHLTGTLFFERMTEEALDPIREGLQALEAKYEKLTGLPSPERIEIRQSRKAAVGFGKS